VNGRLNYPGAGVRFGHRGATVHGTTPRAAFLLPFYYYGSLLMAFLVIWKEQQRSRREIAVGS
jgi:hypothetical protein